MRGVLVLCLLVVFVGGGSRVFAQSCTLYQAGTAENGFGTSPGPQETSQSAAQADAQQILQQAAINQVGASSCVVSGQTFQGCAPGPDGPLTCSATAPACTDPPTSQNPFGVNHGATNYRDGIATSAGSGAQCTNPCTAKAGQTAYVGGSVSGNYCDGTCLVQTSLPSMTVVAGAGPDQTHPSVYTSTYTGQKCSTQTTGANVSGTPQCVSGGVTACADQPAKPNCGTFNGDEVCPQSIPPGTCVSYASGGVACVASSSSSPIASPPAPNNGTAGTAAAASGTAKAGGGLGSSAVTADYYTAAQVAASSSGVQSAPGGQNVGNGGTAPLGSSGGSGSAPSSANGDCGASGVSCTGDGQTPVLPSEPTIAQSTQSYVSGLSAVPIVAAVSSLSSSIPAGQCPTASFSLFGQSYVLDVQCSMWSSVAGVVSACFLAMWTILGVRIAMSA